MLNAKQPIQKPPSGQTEVEVSTLNQRFASTGGFASAYIGRRLSTLVFCGTTRVTRTNIQSCCERLALADVDRCTSMKSEFTFSHNKLVYSLRLCLWKVDKLRRKHPLLKTYTLLLRANNPISFSMLAKRYQQQWRSQGLPGRNIFFRITVQYYTYQLSPATEF